MRKWLYIYLISIAGTLLAACSNQELIPEETGGEAVYITFTLAVSDNTASRATTWEEYDGEGTDEENTDNGTEDDNYIAPQSLKVLICDPDGTPKGEVEKLWYAQTEKNNVYEFTGVVNSDRIINGNDYKIMVFANCPETTTTMTTFKDIEGLSYTFASATQIPMWGVKQQTLSLVPGVRNDLGAIHVLRAMAKVEVALSNNEASRYELVGVTLNKYNQEGYCLPHLKNGISSLTATTQLDTEEVQNPLSSSSPAEDLTFKNGKTYVPEYQNDGSLFMTVTLKSKSSGNTKEYQIAFNEYNDGEKTDTPMQLVRNHYYLFEIASINEAYITLKTTVCPWGEKTAGDITFN